MFVGLQPERSVTAASVGYGEWLPCAMGGSCEAAAEGGQLEVLQWSRGEGCSWSSRVCSLAAGGGGGT